MSGFITDHSEFAALGTNLYRVMRIHVAGYGHSETDFNALPRAAVDEGAIGRALTEHRARFLRGYEERLAHLVDLCRANRIEPILVTQPALYGDANDPATGLDLSSVQFHPGVSGALEWRVLEAYNDVTRRVAARGGLLLVDLARALPKDPQFYYDFMHFTNAGAEAVGTIVAERLVPHLLERAGSPSVAPGR